MICEKCGAVLRVEMKFCPLCGASTNGTENEHGQEDHILTIRQFQKQKKYTEIAKCALTGNVFAEYAYIQYAIQKMKTWTQDAEGTSYIRQAMEQNNPAALAIWGVMLYVANRSKGTFEMLFEGPGSDRAAYERGIELIQRAANLGDAAALSYMGAWCASGSISQVLKSERDAYRYTQASVNKNYPTAMYRLGMWYLNGGNGVRKAPDLGYELIEKAAFYGESSAVDFVKKNNEKWFEADLKAAEDKKQITQSVKLLHPISRAVTNDIIFDNAVDLSYDGILFSSQDEVNVYKTESAYADEVLLKCASLDDYLKAWDILNTVNFNSFDKSIHVQNISKSICKKTGIRDTDLSDFAQMSSQCGTIQSDKIVLGHLPNRLIKYLVAELGSDSKHFLHSSGDALADSDKLNSMRVALKIPANELVYAIRPDGMSWNYYSEKSKGYAICSNGFYFKDDNKKHGFLAWKDFSVAKIFLADSQGKPTDNPDKGWIRINEYDFLLSRGKRTQLRF